MVHALVVTDHSSGAVPDFRGLPLAISLLSNSDGNVRQIFGVVKVTLNNFTAEGAENPEKKSGNKQKI